MSFLVIHRSTDEKRPDLALKEGLQTSLSQLDLRTQASASAGVAPGGTYCKVPYLFLLIQSSLVYLFLVMQLQDRKSRDQQARCLDKL